MNLRHKETFMEQVLFKIKTRVLVSGCYDMLHSGHVAFLNEAARYGELHVSVATDKTVELKGPCLIPQAERVYMVENLKSVYKVYPAARHGTFDFEYLLSKIDPDYFFVNSDGHSQAKQDLIQKYPIQYVIGSRVVAPNCQPRSSTELRKCLTS